MLRTLFTRPWIFELGARFYAWFTAQPVWRESCARLAGHFPPAPAGRRLLVLDLGCGPGVSVIEMAARRPDACLVGLDLSPRMLSEARRHTRTAGLAGRIDYVLADAMHLPFAGGAVDMVTGHSFLYLVRERRRVLAEAARVLRPGGHYASMEPHGGGVHWHAALRAYRRELRMVTAIALWRPFSRLHGQLTARHFSELLAGAGLNHFSSELVLHGLGIIGDGEK